MALNPNLNIEDVSAVQILVIPVGKITRQKFEEFKDHLYANSVVYLGELTRRDPATPSTRSSTYVISMLI
jgi:hypothetical protein